MTNFFKAGITRVVGHRGSPRKAHENTFDSFDTAEADGADGFELDVRLTYDGEPVVFHDADLVVEGRRVPLASLTIPELAEIRVGEGERRSRIHTLRDVLLRYGANGRYLVELKPCPTPRPGLMEFRVAALLAQMRLLERAVVLSFSADILRRIKEHEPGIETCLNFDASAYRPAGSQLPEIPRGCGSIGPHLPLATDRLLAEAREAGLFVHVWTVNDSAQAANLATLGAASVISDVPAEIGPAVREVTGQPAPLDLVKATKTEG